MTGNLVGERATYGPDEGNPNKKLSNFDHHTKQP